MPWSNFYSWNMTESGGILHVIKYSGPRLSETQWRLTHLSLVSRKLRRGHEIQYKRICVTFEEAYAKGDKGTVVRISLVAVSAKNWEKA